MKYIEALQQSGVVKDDGELHPHAQRDDPKFLASQRQGVPCSAEGTSRDLFIVSPIGSDLTTLPPDTDVEQITRRVQDIAQKVKKLDGPALLPSRVLLPRHMADELESHLRSLAWHMHNFLVRMPLISSQLHF